MYLLFLVAKQENGEAYKWILGSREGVKFNTRRRLAGQNLKKMVTRSYLIYL